MGVVYQKRKVLWRSRRPGSDSALWLNLRLGLPSISLRLRGVTWNTSRGFSSVRLGHGLSWRDRD